MSEDDLYELAEPDDEPTPPRRPPARPDAVPDAAPSAKTPERDPAPADDAPSTAANEPLAVSPAKARLAREDQRKRAALEQAQDDARKQKRILITVGVFIVLAVALWIWLKFF